MPMIVEEVKRPGQQAAAAQPRAFNDLENASFGPINNRGMGPGGNADRRNNFASDDEEFDSAENAPLSDRDYPVEYVPSDAEEDKEYLERAKGDGIEYESDGSNLSEIPEEHENGYGHNEYMRRYLLNMRTMTWNRDSQGLFDYETRHC